MKEVKRLLTGLILTGFTVATLAGCATPSEQNASIASSASAELASNPCTLQQETVDKYSFISDAVTPIDMAQLSLPDVRAGEKVPQLAMIDMEYAGWFTLASIPEINFYLYGYTKGQCSGESGVVVDYGAEQHIYYFSSLQYGAPRTGEP